MDVTNVEKNVLDNSKAKEKLDSNINEENETTANIIEGKKKRKRKSKAKKKNNCSSNAGMETIDNVSGGSETVNTQMKTTENDTSEKKIADDAKPEQQINNITNAEMETTENAEKEIIGNADTEQKIPTNTERGQEIPFEAESGQESIEDSDADDDFKEYLYDTSVHFVHNFDLYLTRCYDIFHRGISDIEEETIDLPRDCKVLLRGSVGRYKSTNFYNKYYPYVHLENRYEELKGAFRHDLIYKGESIVHSEFLRLGALYFLTAYDLKTRAKFDEAPNSAFDALIDGILLTKQQEFIHLWYPVEE